MMLVLVDVGVDREQLRLYVRCNTVCGLFDMKVKVGVR